jgi:hypothetical protein
MSRSSSQEEHATNTGAGARGQVWAGVGRCGQVWAQSSGWLRGARFLQGLRRRSP